MKNGFDHSQKEKLILILLFLLPVLMFLSFEFLSDMLSLAEALFRKKEVFVNLNWKALR